MKPTKVLSISVAAVVLFTHAAGTFAAEGRPAGGGGGGDIIVFDIIDATAVNNAAGRPAGGGDGGDIIVFDIVDAVSRHP